MPQNRLNDRDIDIERFMGVINLPNLEYTDFIKIALTHPSFIYERTDLSQEDKDSQNREYRRLALLGDAVLRAVVIDYLFHDSKTTDYEHGQLSDLRDTLVSKLQLANFARQMRLKDFALLGKSYDKSNIDGTRLLPEMFESLVAAVYLGFERNMVPANIWFCETFLENAVDAHFSDLEYVLNDEYEDYGITPDDDEYLDMIGLGDSDLGGFVPGDD